MEGFGGWVGASSGHWFVVFGAGGRALAVPAAGWIQLPTGNVLCVLTQPAELWHPARHGAICKSPSFFSDVALPGSDGSSS